MRRSRGDRMRRCLLAGHAALAGLLAVCVAVTPRFALEADEGGFSNYGVRAATVVPYTLAFALSAGLLWAAGGAVPATAAGRRPLGVGLRVVGALLALVLVSTWPYKVDGAFDDVHLAAAGLLFAAEGVVATWSALGISRTRRSVAAWVVWAAGFALAAATVAGAVHVLLVAQAVTVAGFAAVTLSVAAEGGGSRPPAAVSPGPGPPA